MFFPNAEVMVNPLLLILLGVIVGTLGGFFGVGGGFLITAGLLVFGVPTIFAVGTGMALILGSSIINLLKHRHLGNVDYRLAGLTILGTVPALFLAKALNSKLEATGAIGPVIGYLYVALLVFLGLFIIYDYWKTRRWSDQSGEAVSTGALAQRLYAWRIPPHSISFPGLGRVSMYASLPASQIESIHVLIPITIGFAVGFLSGLLGAGGGFIMLPVMIFVIGIPTTVAVGTGLLQIIVTGVVGTALYSLSNNVDLLMAVIMLAAASAGSQLGAAATASVGAGRIRFLFGVTVLSGGVSVALKQVAGSLPNLEYLNTLASVVLLGVSGAMAIFIGVLLLRAKLRARASSESNG
ncbi:MAG: sulfite exporter TauE/SafE family protein [Chloroflexi bacterium]|nr:sulfite exporter TauE/SafE family protein [Chloroflexota bacterium]MDA1219819.1 sulfite exporter TauE/SafE family protein [Chloroflexota bacterium]PKB57201.1 MAG: hypothetical protein BZY73_04435 [SAR202 cluster bacterium Casp-Chloro-G3]